MSIPFKSLFRAKSNVARWGKRLLATVMACMACSNASGQIIIGTQSIVDFSDFNYFEFENAGFAEVTLERFNSLEGSISVLLYTTDITAIEGRDYVGIAQQVTFGDDERQVTVIVPLLDNNMVDGQRLVGLNLADPSPGVEIFNNFALLTIRDDESEINSPAGQLQFTANLYQCTDFESVVPTDGGIIEDWDRRSTPGVLVTVNRVNRMEGKVMVDYRTYELSTNTIPFAAPGFNAISNVDYRHVEGTLVFDDFQTSTNILIRILTSLGATNVNKRFGVELFNPRPFPGEDPTVILPELGIRSRAQVQINKITFSQFFLNSTNAFTNGISFERATYRVDEYRRNIRIAIVNEWGLDGCTDLVWRDPNRTAGIFQAGSGRATLSGNDFDILEADQHPAHGEHFEFLGDSVLRITWPGADSGDPQAFRVLVTLTIFDDSLVEFNEDIFLEVRTPIADCGLPVGNQRIASVTILQDEQSPGSVDREWNPNNVSRTPVPFNPLPGPNNTVRAVALQADGKTVIGGDFTAVNSVESQNRIARLNEDGTLDRSFTTGLGADGFVSAVAVYPLDGLNTNNNGKIVISGGFLSVNGVERQGIARLNTDGTLDTAFNPGSGANGIVWSSLVVAGGKVVIAGDFTEVNGVPRNRVARLNEDGSVDLAFDPGIGADGTIWALGVDKSSSAIRLNAGQFGFGPAEFRTNVDTRASSGTISILFSPQCVPDSIKVYYGGVAIFDSGLVNEFNDIYDPLFGCDLNDFTGPKRYVIPYGPGPSTMVEIVVNEGSGDPGTVWSFEATIENSVVGERLVIGGEFDSFNGFPRRGVARLNSNGTLDQNFDPGGGPNDVVYAVAVQPDLKVLIGGSFTEVDQLPRSGIARFNLDGTVDNNFDPGTGFDDSVFTISIDNNGQAMVGGVFTEFNSTRRVGLARLNTDGSLDTRYMDTAYNHFAGVIKRTSFGPNNSIHSIAFQSDGKVMVGGSFREMGGNHSIDAPRPNRYTVFHRNDIAPRHNLARLVGDWGFTAASPNPPQGPGNMSFMHATYSVDEHGLQLAARLVRSNGFLGRISSVAISTQNLATAGVDYTNAVGRFTWIPGDPPILFFRVPIIDDALIEGDENISMSLTLPSGQITLGGEIMPIGGALGRNFAPVTIIDNDVDQGHFVFSAPVYNVNEAAGTVTINVYRIGGSTTPVQVDYFTLPGTAVDGDFRPRTGTLTFGQNITNATITITLTNQPMVEPDENFFVVLTNSTSGSSLGFSTTDLSFDPGLGANGTVKSISFITNFVNRGKIYIGGEFTMYGGTNRTRVARLFPTGAVDVAFADPQINSNVLTTVIEPSGTLLVGGDFTSIAGAPHSRIARLTDTGTVDSSFDVGLSTMPPPSTVHALAPASLLFFTTNVFTNTIVTTNMFPPGSTNIVILTNEVVTEIVTTTTNNFIIAGGEFGLIRYGPDGADDTNFFNPVVFDGPVYSLAVLQTNRTILVGGAFTTVNGQTNNGVVRLLADFTIDPTFNPVTDVGAVIRSVDHTSQGLVVIGGLFRIRDNSVINNIARLRHNGVLDLAFNPGAGANDEVLRVHVQREQTFLDRVLLGGKFTSVNGRPRNRIARLHADGRTDESFFPNPAANAPVHAIATQLDNKVLVGGEFNLFSGLLRNRIARVSPSIATVNIIDDDRIAGTFSFVDMTFSTNENNLSATVFVKRNGGNAGQVSVTASTSAGTATPGVDYQNVTNVLTWVSFDTNTIKSFTVPLVGDAFVELPETVNLHLRSPAGGAALGLSNAVLVIDNDDFYGTLAFAQQNFETDENGGGVAITVTRSGGSAETVSAQYEVYGITADPGDFDVITNTITFGPGQTSTNFTVAILQDDFQDGDKLVGLRLANPVRASLGLPNPATLTIVDDESFNIPAGSVDTLFGAGAAANSPVYALALQPDGKFFIGGDFTIVNDVTRNRIARLNPNGSLDGRFNVGLGPNLPVRAMALQPDGKLVIGGFFTQVHGTNRAGVARLNRDGTLDAFFNPGAGANNPVYAVALDAIGRIFVGGAFDTIAGSTRPGIALLNTNGTLNTGFTPGTGANGIVYAIAVQPDGKVVIGGEFDLVGNEPRARLARLNADGSLDTTFDPGGGFDAAVRTIALQPDRKILVGGSFTSFDGAPRNFLARLHPDGSLDTAFINTDEGANNAVYALAVQADGKILVGGDFTVFHGRNRNRITRLLPNGKLDPTINFGTGANSFVAAFAIQPDRRIIFGGGFTTYDDQPRGYFARIYGGSIAGSGAFEFISPYFVASENAQKAFVTIRRRGGTSGDTTIDWQTFDITASEGLDYTAVPTSTLFFADGEAVQTVEIPILDDTIVEDTEFIGAFLSSPTGGADYGLQPSASISIVNDDSIISFLSPTFNVSESNLSALATITLVRSGATNAAVSVDYFTSDGTAIAGDDYRSRSDTITFAPNELVKKFTVPIIDDGLVEGNENVILTLTNVTGSAGLATASSELVIVDNDFAPGQFIFSSPVYVVNEYETNIVITVIRTNGTTGIVSVDYATSDGLARAIEDYLPVGDRLSFADGESIKTFSIPIVPDYLDETNETVVIALSNPLGGASLGGTSTAVLTILNSQLINGNLNFSQPTYTVNESNVTATLTVTRTLGSSGPVSVSYRTVDGTAAGGADYNAITNTVSWVAGDTAPKTIMVTLIDDLLVESTEDFTVELFNPTGGASLGVIPTATVNIADADFGPGNLGFTTGNYSVAENATNVVLEVVRNFGNTGTVTIAYAIVPGGSAVSGVHYSNVTGVLSFGPGVTNLNFTVPIIDNFIVEVDRTFKVELSNPTGGATTNGRIISTIVTIVENDQEAGSLDLSFNNVGANDQVYAVLIQTNNNKMFVGGDFTQFSGLPRSRIVRLQPNGTVDGSFDAGGVISNSVRALAIQNDGKVIVGGAFTGVSISSNAAVNYLTRLHIDGMVDTNFFGGLTGVDNFVYALALQNDGKILVGGAFTSVNGATRNHIVRLDPSGQIDLNFNATAGANGTIRAIAIQSDGKILIGGDFTLVNGALRSGVARLNPNGTLDATFDPEVGADDSVQAIAVQSDGRILVGGVFVDFNTVTVNHIVRLLENGEIDTSFDTGAGANEFVSSIALQPDGRVLVGGGFTMFNGVPRGGLTRLLGNGSTDTSINFGRGANNYVSTIALQTDRKIVIGGGFTEFDGRPRPYIARLNGGENLGPGSLVFTAANYNIVENQTNITITVRRLIGTTNTVTVNFTTANGTALAGTHYIATNGVLSFAPGETIKTFNVRVIDDTIINSNRTLNVVLSNPTGGASLGTPNTALVTIINNDDSLGFNIPFYSVSENATQAVITVERLGGSVGIVTVDYATFDGSAIAGEDYQDTFGTLVFTNGQTIQTFTIPIVNDTAVEGNEVLDLVLSSPTGTAILGRQIATLTIVDDDFSSGLMGFTQPVFTVSERGVTATITVGRGVGSSGAASVDYFTSDGTATAGADYSPTSGRLVFADNEFFKTFTISVSDDALVEGAETVNLSLANPVGAALGQTTATLTILGDEALFNFAQTNFFVIESNLFATITVTRSTDGTGPVSIEFATSNNTAVAGVDYVSTNRVLTWAAGDFSPRAVTVQIINDLVGEVTEDLRLWLVNPAGESASGITNDIPLTILDDDSSFSFESPSYFVTEGSTNATITIVRTGFATGDASVNFATSDGTARAGEDYVFTGVTVAFTNGQTVQTVSVPIIDDALGEPDETVNLILQNPSPGTALGIPSSAVLTIIENEDVISLAGTAFTVDETGSNAVITVVRRGIPTGPVSVSFATTNGSATAGADYLGTNGVLSFQFFETVKTFSVPILDDTVAEGDETVLIRLFNLAGAGFLVAPTNATLTILDNDVSVRFSAANYSVGEAETNAVLTVTRVGATGPAFSVAYSTANGTAVAGPDYGAVTNVLNFGVGQVSTNITVPIVDDLVIEGAQTFTVRLFPPTPANIATLGTPSVATVTIVDDDASIIVGAGAALLSESISPPNGLVDPGETVNINFGFRNIGNVDTTSLQLTLLNTNGVVPTGITQRNLGVVAAGGPTRTAAFSFVANGTNGGRVTATFRAVDGANNLGLVTFTFILGRSETTYVNNNSITINDNAIATPYPATIAISNLSGTVTKVTASLHNINHSFPRDIDILLVGPQGQKVVLMSDAGAGFALNNCTLTFDDAAAALLPESTQITSGTYRPVNYAGPGTADSFPPPAPGIPYTNAALSALSGADPNGTWSLFVVDDALRDAGNIAAGWSLTITTTDALSPSADVCITASDSPDPIVIGGDLTYLYRITNFGPSVATGVNFTNVLPAGAQYISSQHSTGGSSTYNPATHTLDCHVGTLASGAGMTITVVVRPGSAGTITSVASVLGNQADVNPANNTAAVKTTVTDVSLVATRLSANSLRLSWPASATGFTLESCNTLPATSWSAVSGVQIVGGQHQVTINVAPGQRQYFRLHRP